jgi:hypothetical protein
MNHYIYNILDKITGEFYIGVRSCKCDVDKDSYMGSMSTWKPDKTKLTKTVLREFDSRKEANVAENELIRLFIKDPLNRNYHTGTKWLLR